jgi:hypothetical protein
MRQAISYIGSPTQQQGRFGLGVVAPREAMGIAEGFAASVLLVLLRHLLA